MGSNFLLGIIMNMNMERRAAMVSVTMLALALSLFLNTARRGEASEETEHQEMTQSFKVLNMTCATCPLTVKAAMKRLEGVISVDVDSETELATVVYDPEVVTVQEIASASTNVGFPTSVLE